MNFLFWYEISNIQVTIHKDCNSKIQRIHELILRSNQLNYTKKRISLEELSAILSDPAYKCGYVTVTDRFGDYGIVGFYAEKDMRLEHFLFSCRTMGQKIEQWVYAQLGFPELTVVGEVRTILNRSECPGWINQSGINDDKRAAPMIQGKILMKGPCDLSHSLVYIKGGEIDTEFTYVSNETGQIIDAYNHSVHIEGLHTYSDLDKEEIARDCIFVDPAMLSGSFFTKEYDLIILSTLIESTYEIYQKKNKDLKVVYSRLQIGDAVKWKEYLSKNTHVERNYHTKDYFQSFAEKYDCIGYTTPEMYLSFLTKCLLWLPDKTHLCLILGPTLFYNGAEEEKLRHRRLNDAVKEFAANHPRIKYIEIDRCLSDASDFDGGLNHFSSRVYYKIAQEIIRTTIEVTGADIKSYSSRIVVLDSIIVRLRRFIKRITKQDSRTYVFMKRTYDKVYKQR